MRRVIARGTISKLGGNMMASGESPQAVDHPAKYQPECPVKPLRLLWRVIRATRSDILLMLLLTLIFTFAGLLVLIEPQISSYSDALWYCFSVISTIGFGDIVAQTVLGRALSIVLGLFGILVVGVFVGVVVAYYNEFLRVRQGESFEVFADKLEHLPELSKEELVELSAQVKRMRARGKMSER